MPALILVVALSSFTQASPLASAAPPVTVYTSRLSGTVDLGVARYVTRVLQAAAADGAALLLEIDSTGGRVDAALAIRDAMLRSPVPVVTHVVGRAWSAAALIAMAGNTLVMAPGASIGAAEPAPLTAKTLAALRGDFEATAEARGRGPALAGAMVDASVNLPGIVGPGQLLVLTASQAEAHNFSNGIGATTAEALALAGLTGAQVRPLPIGAAEQASRLITHPAVAPVLLTVGLVALAVEVFTAGFGAAGIVGLISLGLFFGGHLVAGFGGWEVAALFVLGIVLLVVEAIIPGFGVFGVAGAGSIIGSIYLASRGSADALRSLAVAVVMSLLLVALALRVGVSRGWFARLALRQATTTEEGFVAGPALSGLLGQTGVAATMLRPAGVARIESANVDVVTEGIYVPAGTRVKVVKVEGPRVVVAPIVARRTAKHNESQGE
ncbi:MAG: NfeD family protein [Bacillota bacterium]|nr:NfeD family protein [Bacillota bacterium]